MKKLLTPAMGQLPFLQGQIEAQRETIQAMQQQSRLADQLSRLERCGDPCCGRTKTDRYRERHAAERASWHVETRALMNAREAEIAAGIRPKKLDLDVGYHQELEAANKRLEMDNRLMAPRVRYFMKWHHCLANSTAHRYTEADRQTRQ